MPVCAIDQVDVIEEKRLMQKRQHLGFWKYENNAREDRKVLDSNYFQLETGLDRPVDVRPQDYMTFFPPQATHRAHSDYKCQETLVLGWFRRVLQLTATVRMTSEFHARQYYDDVSCDAYFGPSGILHSVPSNAIVVRDQVCFYQEPYDAFGSGRTMFQLIRNNHELIIWGPPVIALPNLMVQLQLIETLLGSIPFDDVRQATLYIAQDGRSRLIQQDEKQFQIPYLGGYRCIDESQLQATKWLQAGWKRALLDGAKPVGGWISTLGTTGFDYSNFGLSVKCVEEGARMASYKDRILVYDAFRKMQERHIYLLDGHNMEQSAVLIVDDKVRFVDMALKRWFSPNVFIYDRMIHDEQQLKQARQAHWRQVELFFDRIDTEASTSNRYRPCEYRLINVIPSPRMFSVVSAHPSVVFKRREKGRRRSSEPPSDTACDRPYMPGRVALARSHMITRESFIRRPGPHMIVSESSLSSLSASSTSYISSAEHTS
ncbi:hypothetical protein IW261DRAFT_1421264 [Armillaria novae-zelandiae]|uniref:Uncharacterized protein n=1 Tax=Armillaria novae-zelandiae TaxID=153914 RepID=A0AA39P3T0_9AGAR|nr:hypothetical protein IW261DRAFT_1421264 [Armillaria novae-zelandiae]